MEPEVARDHLRTEHERLQRLQAGFDAEHLHDQSSEESTGELAHFGQHEADAASSTFEREKDFSILDQVEAELADVERALHRLDDGTYGTCEACGATIGDERLEVLPAARFCVTHQDMAEHLVTDSAERTGGEFLLEVHEVSVRFGGVMALDGLSFDIREGDICGLIGPNGAGKTTCFNVVSRIYEPSQGRIRFAGDDLLSLPAHQIARHGIARTFQNLALFPSMTLLENVMVGAHSQGSIGVVRAALRLPPWGEERRTRVEAYALLQRLGLGEHAFRPAAGLPFGTLKRLELARALAAKPRFLLLDEPASGLTHGEVDELGETIKALRDEFGLTVLLVEHHMAMVMGISDHVVAMDFGRKLAEGTPKQVQTNPAVIEAYLGTSA